MDFLKNLSLDDKDKKNDNTQSHHSSSTSQERGLLDKIGSIVNEVQGSQTPAQPTATATPTHASKTEMLLGKLGEALSDKDGKYSTGTGAPPAASSQQQHKSDSGLFGKISDALSGEKPAPTPPPKEEGLFDKVGNVLMGKKEEPPKPQGLGGALNNLLGGGAKGEQKEDKLDKAIDFVQEHVLKQGPQNNESAIEQMKDKQIADAIRDQYQKFTGKEFPGSKEKK